MNDSAIPTAVWISIVANLVTIGVGYGILQGKVAALREIVAELRAGRDRTGERLGALEADMKLIKFVTSRRLTNLGYPAEDPPEKGGG